MMSLAERVGRTLLRLLFLVPRTPTPHLDANHDPFVQPRPIHACVYGSMKGREYCISLDSLGAGRTPHMGVGGST